MKTQISRHLQFAKADGVSNSGTFIDGYAVSATFTSAAFNIAQALGYCLAVTCPSTGSPVGTVKVQGSVDDVSDLHGSFTPDATLKNWFDISFVDMSTGSIIVSQALSTTVPVVFEDAGAFYRWIRVVVTMSSGTATLTVTCQAKGV